MKTYQTNEIRNIALLGSIGSGKTTLAEAMLFEGKVIDRRGDVNNKNTVSDYLPIEHENESSVFPTVLYTEYLDKKLNFVDAPGADDFVAGAVVAMEMADTGIMVLNAQHGVEVGTEILSRRSEKRNVPIIFAVNQLDHEKANWEKVTETLQTSFGSKAVQVQYPINAGAGFDAIIDVLLMKMYKFKGSNGEREILDIPESEMAKAEELHNTLVEAAAENDEALMELFFEKGSLDENELRKGIKAGLINRDLFPVFCVSAKNDMGVKRFMEFIINVAPAPNEVDSFKDSEGNPIKVDPAGKATAFIFRTSIEEHIGEINYFKVVSGEIVEGGDYINTNTDNKERLSQIYAVAGKNRTKVSKLVAGDVGAAVKLKGTKNNQTLAAPGHEVIVSPIEFPEPKYRTAIRPTSEGDEEKLGEALNRMHQDDPTIIIEYSKELKQIIVHGQGEYHLNMLKWHLDNKFKIEAEFIAPKIQYRETITKLARADYRHKKQSGGAGQFGEVHMIIEPYTEGSEPSSMLKVDGQEFKLNVRDKEEHKLAWGGKLEYCNCIVGGSIDARFMPAILKGIMEKLENGPLTGSYARDIRVYVYDGKMHPVDSNEISFKLAGRNAFSSAFKIAGPKIMEPVYDVEVLVPAEYLGDVMSDITSRRGMVQGMTSEKGFEKVKARVPLAEMNKYSTTLSSMTGGRATYSMRYSEYAQVPGDVQEKLIKTFEAEQEEE